MLTSVTRVTRLKAMLGAEIVKPVSTSIKMCKLDGVASDWLNAPLQKRVLLIDCFRWQN
jgi:hypothetical protein